MKLVVDANLSPVIVRAASLVVDPESCEFLHVYAWLGEGIPDEDLFEKVATEGACLFTCDRNQRRTPRVREALRAASITTFFAHQEWANGGRFEQVRRFLNWWPEMRRAHDANLQGSWFEIPYRVKNVRLNRLVDSPGPPGG